MVRSEASHHCANSLRVIWPQILWTHFNILILTLPLGSFLFSGLLAGILYDMKATTTTGGGNTCIGPHCYRLVFIVMAAACLIGFFFDLLLSIRTKMLYKRIYFTENSNKNSLISSRR
ncbi:hypothetical protein V8G54_035914 [Vigna mungo]|uniref:NFD4 C-terminal domain-containing protein n=1 Tax=Vigna mungo TaxID=3915 RepID=A0AAQ3RG30_VIGMU